MILFPLDTFLLLIVYYFPSIFSVPRRVDGAFRATCVFISIPYAVIKSYFFSAINYNIKVKRRI